MDVFELCIYKFFLDTAVSLQVMILSLGNVKSCLICNARLVIFSHNTRLVNFSRILDWLFFHRILDWLMVIFSQILQFPSLSLFLSLGIYFLFLFYLLRRIYGRFPPCYCEKSLITCNPMLLTVTWLCLLSLNKVKVI